MECLRTKCANRSANAIANIKIQFFNIKIQFIDIIKHGTNNKIYNLECKIQTLILAVITLHNGLAELLFWQRGSRNLSESSSLADTLLLFLFALAFPLVLELPELLLLELPNAGKFCNEDHCHHCICAKIIWQLVLFQFSCYFYFRFLSDDPPVYFRFTIFCVRNIFVCRYGC